MGIIGLGCVSPDRLFWSPEKIPQWKTYNLSLPLSLSLTEHDEKFFREEKGRKEL